MSELVHELVRQVAMPAPAKPVLMAYALDADDDGYCWSGIERIAFDTGFSAATIKRVRADLIAAGWMESRRRPGESAITRLNLAKIEQCTRHVEGGDVTSTWSERILVRKDVSTWHNLGETALPVALVLDPRISWDAKGAYAWLLLAADDPAREVTAKSLGQAGPRGRDHAQRMVRELEEHGWVSRYRRPEAGAKQPIMVYELHSTPLVPDERTFRPSTARPRRRSNSTSGT